MFRLDEPADNLDSLLLELLRWVFSCIRRLLLLINRNLLSTLAYKFLYCMKPCLYVVTIWQPHARVKASIKKSSLAKCIFFFRHIAFVWPQFESRSVQMRAQSFVHIDISTWTLLLSIRRYTRLPDGYDRADGVENRSIH